MSFLILGPELSVTIGLEGCVGERALIIYCLHRRSKPFLSVRGLFSMCVCISEVLFWQLVMFHSAEFWMFNSLMMFESAVFGAITWTALMVKDHTRTS